MYHIFIISDGTGRTAELALKDAEVKIARDEYGFTKNDITIDKFFNRFVEYSKASHQPATTARYRVVLDHFKLFLRQHSHVTFLSEISTDIIDRYKVFRKGARMNSNTIVDTSLVDESELSNKKGIRAHTVNFEIRTLKLVFNLAIKREYLKDNPTKEVAKLKVNDSKPPQFLSVDECKRFLKACPAELYPIYFAFLIVRERPVSWLVWQNRQSVAGQY